MKSSTTYVSNLTTIGDGTQHMIGYAQNAQAGYIEAPTNAQQQDGVVPLDRLPAQWWNWFLNKATRRFTESEDFLENAVAELDNVLDAMGITPDPTSTTQLKTMFSSNYLQQYLPKIAAQASAFSVDGTHENYIPVADNDGNNGHTLVKVPYAPSLVVNSQLISTTKNITLPANCPYDGQTIKVVFTNGHQAGSASDHMTLNVNNGLSPAPIVSNQNGTLDYLPIHELTAGTYSVLQANTVLEMYYTETGFSGNPAFVVVGNPLVLSSATYSIYANGYTDYFNYYNTGTVVYNYSNDVAVPQGGYTFSHEETVPSDGFYLLRCSVNNKSEVTVSSNSTKITMGGYIILEVSSYINWSPLVDTIVIPLKKGTKLKFDTQFTQGWAGKSIYYSFFMLKLQ